MEGNDDGKLHYKEAVNYYVKHCGPPVQDFCPSQEEFLNGIFDTIDKHSDGDGKVTGEEWVAAKKAFEEHNPEEFNDPEVQEFIGTLEAAAEVYTKDDGAVSRAEAEKLFEDTCLLPLP